jgi:hypothetical protein
LVHIDPSFPHYFGRSARKMGDFALTD